MTHTYKYLYLLLILILTACTAQPETPMTTPPDDTNDAEPTSTYPPIVAPTVAVAGQETRPPAAEVDGLPPNFDVQGHRGARGLKPENTLPAFETALDLGVTTLELDLHYTADGVVVVWHDDTIDSEKCDVSGASDGAMISQLTLAELQHYRCDRNPDPAKYPEQDNSPTTIAGDDYRIISLAQLFDFVAAYAADERKTDAQRENAAQVHFNIETKRQPGNPVGINDGFDGSAPGPFEQAINALVVERGLTGRVILQSFDHRSLWAMRQLNPDMRLAALSIGTTDPTLYAEQGADIWSPSANDLTPDLIERAHDAGLLVIPWTVNDPDDMRYLISIGVDGLISDRPDLLLALDTGS